MRIVFPTRPNPRAKAHELFPSFFREGGELFPNVIDKVLFGVYVWVPLAEVCDPDWIKQPADGTLKGFVAILVLLGFPELAISIKHQVKGFAEGLRQL